ncbi:hypothetical protein Tco_0660627 [Tanacetum coccineum]
MLSSPSPEPTIGYFDDLDFLKDFENELPAIVYNDLKSKSDLLNEPSVSSQHIDKFETSLSKYDEKEQNVLYLNDSFPLNVIFSNNPKTIKDNDDNIDITQLSRSNVLNIDAKRSNELPRINHDKTNKVFNEKFFIMTLDADIVSWNYFNNWMPLNLIKNLYVPFGIPLDPKRYYKDDMAPLPHRNLRHPWLLYQVGGYDEGIVHNGMRQTLKDRLSMMYAGDDEEALFTSHAWRRLFELDGARRRMTWKQFILALGLHSEEEMAEPGFGAYWSGSERVILDKGGLRDYWIEILSDMDFLGPAPSYVHIRDPIRRLCHRMIACSIFGRAQGAEKYLFHHAEGRKSEARLSRGHFIGRIVAHFGLVGDQGLRGLSMVVSELPVIDLHELDMLNICARFGDMWPWVAPRPERQQAATAGALGAAEGAPAADEGAQAVLAPV